LIEYNNMVSTRSVTAQEKKQMRQHEVWLTHVRGEFLSYFIEIEAVLEEIIGVYFARPTLFNKFMDILSWERFSSSFKIEFFQEVDLGRDNHEYHADIMRKLKQLNAVRNEVAHGLPLISPDEIVIIKARNKTVTIDEAYIKNHIQIAKETLVSLRAILYWWAGITSKDIKSTKSVWIDTKKIRGHFAENPNFDPTEVPISRSRKDTQDYGKETRVITPR